MNTKLLMASATALLTVAACTHSPTALPPGHYETSTESVNSAGTKTTADKTTDVTVDKYGNKKAVVETETSKDPKGLFNKSTATKKTVVKDSGY